MASDKRTGKARQGTHPKVALEDVTVLPGGKVIYKTTSGQAARGVITQAAKDENRVAIRIRLKNGDVREAWRNPRGHPPHDNGASADWVRGKLGKTAGSLKKAIASQAEEHDYDAAGETIKPSDIKEIQVTVYT